MTAKLDNGNELSQCENGHADKHKKKAKEKRDVSILYMKDRIILKYVLCYVLKNTRCISSELTVIAFSTFFRCCSKP